MLGLGFPEIVFIVVVAAIVLGPEHMPRAANMLGKWSAKLRSAATTFGEAIAKDEDLREIQTTVHEVKSEIETVKSELTVAKREVLGVSGDAQSAFEAARRELKSLGRVSEVESEQGSDDIEAMRQTSVDGEDKSSSSADILSQATVSVHASEHVPPGLYPILLARPILLPGEISRQVSRFRIPLAAVSTGADVTAPRILVLSKPCGHAPFLRIRKLERVGSCSGTLHCVKLSAVTKLGAGGGNV